MKRGTKVRIISNGLKTSDKVAGITPDMLKMQGKIYSVEDVDTSRSQVKINRFWFSIHDVTEQVIDKPQVHVDNALFNPENLDL